LNPTRSLNQGTTMSQHMTHSDRPTSAWVNFSYISFATSVLMVGGGISRFRWIGGRAPTSQWEWEC
jgi:hypothetical protein